MVETATAPPPRPPTGLKRRGRTLWTNVHAIVDMSQEPHRLELLTQACRVVDRIHELEAARSGQPLTVRGSNSNIVINPLIAEARFQGGLLTQLVKSLGIPETAEALAEKADILSGVRRTAAKSAHLSVVRT